MPKPALMFALFVVVLDSVGFGLLIPVLPSLLEELGNTDISGASGISLWLSFSYALMQFLFGPLLGTLSDRFGRKPVLMVSIAALGIDYVVLATAPHLWVLFVGRLIAGIAGATFSTAFAVADDVSTPEEKGANIGLVSAGFGLGFVLGPALGGVIGEAFGPRGPIWAAAGVSALNLIFGLLFFRESLPIDARRRFDMTNANPFTALFALRFAGSALLLVLCYFIFNLATNVYQLVWPFFTEARFGWGEQMTGLSLAAVGVGFIVAQAGVLRSAIKRFGVAGVLIGALVIEVIALAITSVLSVGWMAFVFIPMMALGSLATPTLNTLISSRVPKDQQGAIQGLLSSMLGLSLIIGPFLYNGSFQWFTRQDAGQYWPGAPFAIAAVLAVVVLLLTLFSTRQDRQSARVAD